MAEPLSMDIVWGHLKDDKARRLARRMALRALTGQHQRRVKRKPKKEEDDAGRTEATPI